MDLLKLFLWLVFALVAWVVLSTVLSIVIGVIKFVAWLIQTGVMLAILGAVAYGGYKLYDLLSDDSSTQNSIGSQGRTDSINVESETTADNPQDRYARGEIDEAQLERELERELGDSEMDSIDRELQRERS